MISLRVGDDDDTIEEAAALASILIYGLFHVPLYVTSFHSVSNNVILSRRFGCGQRHSKLKPTQRCRSLTLF